MKLNLSNIKPAKGATKNKKRVGRGNGSGMGTYSGRGQNGQGSRTGKKFKSWFEGGQTSFLQRIPKLKGFKNPTHKEYQPLNLSLLNEKYENGEILNPDTLLEKKLIESKKSLYKILGDGEISKKITVQAYKISKTATEKLEKAGCKVEIVNFAIPQDSDKKKKSNKK